MKCTGEVASLLSAMHWPAEMYGRKHCTWSGLSIGQVVSSPGGKQAVEILVKDGSFWTLLFCLTSFEVKSDLLRQWVLNQSPMTDHDEQAEGTEVILFGGVDAKAPIYLLHQKLPSAEASIN